MSPAALAAAVLLLGTAPAVERASEPAVKAAFLFNFARFVEWPGPPAATFVVAVLGGGPLAESTAALHGKALGDQRLVVRVVSRPEDARGARILLVTREAEVAAEDVARALRGQAVLTVGDREGFAAAGGMINFVVRDHKVRFDVNLRAAQAEELRISSQLLKLASIVGERAP